ncbi:hypothetical protein Tco_0315472, partial [Tanacetum coccineum]
MQEQLFVGRAREKDGGGVKLQTFTSDDLISHCKIRVGKGTGTSFWKDLWIGDNLLVKLSFPRLFALEENKDISVADKMNTSIFSSFRRHVRGGVESQQLDQLLLLLDTVI